MAQMPKRPWPIILTFAGIVVLVIAWCVYWFIASGIVRDGLEGGLARLARDDIALDCKAMNWSGFPFRFERDCLSPHLKIKDDSATASRLLLVMQAYMPNRAIALIEGPVTTGSGITITHERALASARFSGERDWQASLELPKLDAMPYGSTDRLLVSARDTGGDRIDIALDASAADLVFTGTGLKLDEASLAANVPRDAVSRDILRALARSGQKIGIDAARLKKGDLVMTAKGEIGLGPRGEINGRLVTISNRLDLLIAELKQNFGLSDKDAQTLTTMIGLLQPGTTTDITLDLIAKDGKLYWGPVKLTDLPPVF